MRRAALTNKNAHIYIYIYIYIHTHIHIHTYIHILLYNYMTIISYIVILGVVQMGPPGEAGRPCRPRPQCARHCRHGPGQAAERPPGLGLRTRSASRGGSARPGPEISLGSMPSFWTSSAQIEHGSERIRHKSDVGVVLYG